jgi:hypothetical protein
MRKYLILILALTIFGASSNACSNPSNLPISSFAQSKASSLLLLQISLRQEQLTNPTLERLSQMQDQGMNTNNLKIQRVYIYFKQPLNPSQIIELQALDIIIYLNSWMPPTGSNPNGFYLADLPVDKLEALTSKDYVIKLDTAEVQSQPQID